MGTTPTTLKPVEGHGPRPVTAYRSWPGVAATPTIDPDEMAFTRPAVLDARGWDQRHRRYRRRLPAPVLTRMSSPDGVTT